MASKAGNGMVLYLDRVPQREEGMTAYEMMLSESQERMLFVVEPDKEEQAKEIFTRWGLICENVGNVTEDGMLTLIHHGDKVAEIPVTALVDECPVYNKPSKVPAYYEENASVDPASYAEVDDLAGALLKILASPTVASKEWIYNQYDYMVRTSTAVGPGSDAAVVTIRGTRKALAMTTDCNGRYVYLDPKVGGAIAVAEAARNIVCSGGLPLAITDNLNFGSPEKPEIFWQLEQAADGITEACLALDTPVIGGNVSLYNENAKGAIYPTPVIGMVGLVEDIDHITTQGFKNSGDIVYLLGETKAEIGGSELQKVWYGRTEGRPPQIDLQAESKLQTALLSAIRQGLVASAHDCSEGGVAVALAEASISGKRGVNAQFKTALRADHLLFSESQSRVVVSVAPQHSSAFAQLLQAQDVPFTELGHVTDNADFSIRINDGVAIDLPVADLEKTWKGAIPWLMQ